MKLPNFSYEKRFWHVKSARQRTTGSRGRQKPIKNGDQRSFSIAAASILAKVHRDKIMRALARRRKI